MKAAALICLTAVVALSPNIAWAADTAAIKPLDRTVLAERKFGDVRFVIGGGNARRWLEMHADGNLVAAFSDFVVDEVIASPDHQHFLALSNASKSSYAFAILDRKGQIVESSPHGGDLHYCNRTSWGIAEWIDTQQPRATFNVAKNQLTTPSTDFLFVTVRGCDGKTVILAKVPPPSLKATPARANTISSAGTRIPVPEGQDRASFFIGDTIKNLRGLDPAFAGRTLTLIDGRRAINPVIRPINLPAGWTDAALSERRICPTGGACGAADLLINRADGSTQQFATGLTGNFIALPGSRRVFACEYSTAASERSGPVVVDLIGGKVSLPSHPGPLRVCTRTGTGDEVLLVYTVANAGQRFTLARVFDASGALLAEKTYDKAGTVEFSVAGKRHSETVPGP